jgi:hypothetical protein
MLQNGHDLTASLAGCRAATRRGIGYWSCEQGVMMQNSLRYAELPTLARAAAAGCRTVAASRRLAHLCFDNLGAVAALANRHDAAAATTVCRQLAQTRAASSCLAGVRSEIDEARRAAARP